MTYAIAVIFCNSIQSLQRLGKVEIKDVVIGDCLCRCDRMDQLPMPSYCITLETLFHLSPPHSTFQLVADADR